jgi:glutathione S-transferase
LMLRMPRAHADALIPNAAELGLSYGEYVARLVEGSRLPQPTVEREADRAALLASNDELATLSADLNALARFLGRGSHEEAQKHRQRLETADAEVRRHLERASAFLGHAQRSKP